MAGLLLAAPVWAGIVSLVLRFDAWINTHGGQLHPPCSPPPRGLDDIKPDARAAITLALVDAIEQLNRRIAGLERHREALELHPDAHIFTSLLKAGSGRPHCWPRS